MLCHLLKSLHLGLSPKHSSSQSTTISPSYISFSLLAPHSSLFFFFFNCISGPNGLLPILSFQITILLSIVLICPYHRITVSSIFSFTHSTPITQIKDMNSLFYLFSSKPKRLSIFTTIPVTVSFICI